MSRADPLPRLRFSLATATTFRAELQAETKSYLDGAGRHRFADWRVGAKVIALAMVSGCLYVLALQAHGFGGFVLPYLGFHFVAMLLGMNALHDAAHGALMQSPAHNRWLMRCISIPIGIDPAYWAIRHVHFHHSYANIDGYDLDTDPNPFLRQTPYQRWLPHFRYQHWYWPLVAALSLPYLCWYSDWADHFGKTRLAARIGPRNWSGFGLTKTAHLCVALLLPLWVLRHVGIGWGEVLGCYLLGQMLASSVLVAMILGTHWAEVEFFEPAAGGVMPHTWHEHAFRTACDWTPRPRWLGFWLGGLNWHLTHHLLPTFSHRHYQALAPIIARLAQRHGLDYRRLSYPALVKSQQTFLRAMGAGDFSVQARISAGPASAGDSANARSGSDRSS